MYKKTKSQRGMLCHDVHLVANLYRTAYLYPVSSIRTTDLGSAQAVDGMDEVTRLVVVLLDGRPELSNGIDVRTFISLVQLVTARQEVCLDGVDLELIFVPLARCLCRHALRHTAPVVLLRQVNLRDRPCSARHLKHCLAEADRRARV